MINSLDDLAARLSRFADERDWQQFHSPKNLVMALGVEVAELAEHFQWLSQQESQQLDADRRAAVRLELADILIYLVRLADRLEVDLLSAAEEKLAVNNRKYPVISSRGRAKRPGDREEQS
jgi:dCTP diphosphatase